MLFCTYAKEKELLGLRTTSRLLYFSFAGFRVYLRD